MKNKRIFMCLNYSNQTKLNQRTFLLVVSAAVVIVGVVVLFGLCQVCVCGCSVCGLL